MHIVHTRNQIKPPLGCELVVAKRSLLVFLLQVEAVVPVCALEPGFVRIEGSAIEGSCIGKGIRQNPFDGRGLTICLLERVS